jgi:hypothetical protein
MSETIVASKPSRTRSIAADGGVGFELILDHSAYERTPHAASLTATLILRSPASGSVSLTFLTGQEFDVQLHDAAGTQVGLWSKGRVFADHVRTVDFKGEHKWVATMALPETHDAVHAKTYTATAFLTPSGARPYLATVAFTVRASPVI